MWTSDPTGHNNRLHVDLVRLVPNQASEPHVLQRRMMTTKTRQTIALALAVTVPHLICLMALGRYNRVDVKMVSGESREVPVSPAVTYVCRTLQYPLITTDVVFCDSRIVFGMVVAANSLIWGVAVSLSIGLLRRPTRAHIALHLTPCFARPK